MCDTEYGSTPNDNFQATFRPHRKYFQPSHTARTHGYFPKSHWTKLDREIIGQEKPALAVARSWRTRSPRDDEIILAWNDLNEYVVTNQSFEPKIRSRNCWPVYHETETRIASELGVKHFEGQALEMPKAARPPSDMTPRLRRTPSEKPQQESTSVPPTTSTENKNNTTTLPPYIPLRCTFRHKCRHANNFGNTPTKANNRRVNSGEWVYIPETFDPNTLPEPHRDGCLYLIGQIYLCRILDRLDRDSYVNLMADHLRAIMGWREADTAKRILLGRKIVECDHHYEKGRKALGYRLFDEELRHATHRLVKIDHPTIRRNTIKRHRSAVGKRVHQWLSDQLDHITIEGPAAYHEAEQLADRETKLLAYRGSIQAILDGYLDFNVDDFAGRVHTNFTRLKRELKKHVRIDGQRPVEVDIRNSQPLFLALCLKANGVEDREYSELCEQGRLYDHIASLGGWTRDEAKEGLIATTFFGKNHQTNEVKRLFDRTFPAVAEYIRRTKAKDYKRLSQQLQRAEAKYIIHGVCDRIRKERPATRLTTIHDSILTTPEAAEYVMVVMAEEFATLGVGPRLEAEPCE